jgi:hypothetical protein
VREIPSVNILCWASDYDLRSDGFSLSEASQKQYLEDLLTVVRRSLDPQRLPSISPKGTPVRTSTPSQPSLSHPSGTVVRTSTPTHQSQGLTLSQSVEIDADVRYMKKKV